MTEGELCFSKGDVLTVDRQVDQEWLLCSHGNESGLVHVEYVQGLEWRSWSWQITSVTTSPWRRRSMDEVTKASDMTLMYKLPCIYIYVYIYTLLVFKLHLHAVQNEVIWCSSRPANIAWLSLLSYENKANQIRHVYLKSLNLPFDKLKMHTLKMKMWCKENITIIMNVIKCFIIFSHIF